LRTNTPVSVSRPGREGVCRGLLRPTGVFALPHLARRRVACRKARIALDRGDARA